jgi:hypothetical protein
MRLLTVLCADPVLARRLLVSEDTGVLQLTLISRIVTWVRLDKGEASLVRPTAIQLLLTIEFVLRAIGTHASPASPTRDDLAARKRSRSSKPLRPTVSENTHVATISVATARYLLIALHSSLQALGVSPVPSRTVPDPTIAFASVPVADGLVQLLALAGHTLIDVFEKKEKLIAVTPQGLVPALAAYHKFATKDGNEVAAAAALRLTSILSATR